MAATSQSSSGNLISMNSSEAEMGVGHLQPVDSVAVEVPPQQQLEGPAEADVVRCEQNLLAMISAPKAVMASSSQLVQNPVVGGKKAYPSFLQQLNKPPKRSADGSKPRRKKAKVAFDFDSVIQIPPAITEEISSGNPTSESEGDALNPPPLNPPSPIQETVPCSDINVWRSGMTPSLSNALELPPSFLETAPLTEEGLRKLGEVEISCLQASSFVQGFRQLNSKLVSTHNDLLACREERQKTYEELLLRQQELSLRQEELNALKNTHSITVKSLQDREDEIKGLKADLDSFKVEKDGLSADLATSKLSVDKLKADLEAANKDYEESQSALAASVEGSFNNAVQQLQLLNPGVVFNTTGLNSRFFVIDGVLVPPPPPSSPAISESPGGDE